MKLDNRNIFVTGGNQGLGREIARHCLEAGASVWLFARDAGRLERTRAELADLVRPGRRLGASPLDVSDAGALGAAFDEAAGQLGGIDGLVNNAGVYGPMGLSEEVDWSNWLRAIEINLFGTLHACRWAIPRFRTLGRGKIVNLSGGGATAPLPRFSAYACSKAAVVRLTETLSEELRGTGIDVNAIAPGALNTRLLDEVLEAGPEKVGRDFFDRAVQQRDRGGAPLDRGAALAVYLLSTESDGISGKLISAVWDPWPTLAEHREELSSSDIYTLRRITPEDRGKDWAPK